MLNAARIKKAGRSAQRLAPRAPAPALALRPPSQAAQPRPRPGGSEGEARKMSPELFKHFWSSRLVRGNACTFLLNQASRNVHILSCANHAATIQTPACTFCPISSTPARTGVQPPKKKSRICLSELAAHLCTPWVAPLTRFRRAFAKSPAFAVQVPMFFEPAGFSISPRVHAGPTAPNLCASAWNMRVCLTIGAFTVGGLPFVPSKPPQKGYLQQMTHQVASPRFCTASCWIDPTAPPEIRTVTFAPDSSTPGHGGKWAFVRSRCWQPVNCQHSLTCKTCDIQDLQDRRDMCESRPRHCVYIYI